MKQTTLFCSQETKCAVTPPRPLRLATQTVTELRGILPDVADRTVVAIIDDVPSYSDALTGAMGETIRLAVRDGARRVPPARLALQRRRARPPAAALDGAYQLGRGEARSGRTVDALLSAYRIGARVSWREMSAAAVRTGVDADTLARFAELVFAYIEQLSAASLAGHNDELETTGRVRQRLLERLASPAPRRIAGRDRRGGRRAGRVAAAEDADGGRRTGVTGAARPRRGAGGDAAGAGHRAVG